MMRVVEIDYHRLELPYGQAPPQGGAASRHHRVIVVGAGPVGLTLAIDLAQQGIDVALLDDDHRLSTGSRAICFAKRTLEIWDRLGCGQRMVDKGVSWNVGKVFFQDELVYSFNLLADSAHHRPAFINLQQYYVEGYLYEHAARLAKIDLRWRSKVIGVDSGPDHAVLSVETPDGNYELSADYVVACDGARSTLRNSLGLESKGRVFRDRFLIADVKMQAAFPAERWFWFDPPFHRNQSVLLHRQPDNVWRIDFQLGWDADPEIERQPGRVIPRVQALLGKDTPFELEWVSVYTFSCQRMEKFRHARVLFAGDAAHGVSPFGARGANSGVQDADNLAWKLRYVLEGKAPDRLLDSYASEREYAADENILHSTRATDFITPKSAVSRTFRDAVLNLAKDCPFARTLMNSGRLSTPTLLRDSPLNTPDMDTFAGAMLPGAPLADAPVRLGTQDSWLLAHVGGEFAVIYFHAASAPPTAVAAALRALRVKTVCVALAGTRSAASAPEIVQLEDAHDVLWQRYDAHDGTLYLIRPDQHVCARWRGFDRAALAAALARATTKA
jgi:3-(3-hydroxy-phenyl)propionate hydroxylase